MIELETSLVHTLNPLATSNASPLMKNKDLFGASRTPLYNNATFEFEHSDTLANVSKDMGFGFIYSRSGNPTVQSFEERIRGISKAMGVVATTSGMAAITLATLSLCKSGDCFITTDRIFGHTLGFFKQTLKNLGIEAVFVDLQDLKALRAALQNSHAKMLFFETLNNPWLQTYDIKALCNLAHEYNVPVVADSTLTPFGIFDAKKHGVDIEVISSTKIISGGGGGLAGLVLDYGNFNWESFDNLKAEFQKSGKWAFVYKARKEIMLYLGLIANPANAHAHLLGLETLSLRAEKACSNALKLAEFLESQNISTSYPALRSSPYFQLCNEQFNGRGGCILTFSLANKQKAHSFMDALQIIKIATNIYDAKTLIISPSDVLYPQTPLDIQEKLGIRENMLRLSVGIENVNDLIDDIKVALKIADTA